MMSKTYIAAVRFKDGSKIKLHVFNVPDDVIQVRNVILNELRDNQPPVQSVVVRTDSYLTCTPF